MKQILQNLKSGTVELTEVPMPHVKAGHVLIETRLSLISAGTERMLLEFGKANQRMESSNPLQIAERSNQGE